MWFKKKPKQVYFNTCQMICEGCENLIKVKWIASIDRPTVTCMDCLREMKVAIDLIAPDSPPKKVGLF